MEQEDGARGDIVDPEVRARVSNLVTSLGGSSTDDGRYELGDDALGVLKDIKNWLKLSDVRRNRLDVQRCLAEANIVGGDLLQILAAWPEHATENRIKARIALACVEVLVILTLPQEKNPKEMTVNHHRHVPFLEIAQLGYKRSIINFDGARILHTAVRCALPSMAEALGDRSTRDEGIIKLVLYFIRNIAMIAPPPDVQYDGDEAEISRSATIDAFDYQDILHLLLTISSTIGEDFNTQDVVVMEILFYLIKGVDVEKLFMDEKAASNSKVDELVRLRQKEAAMLRSYQTNAPTRHNRFGAMAWIQRDDAKRTTISGQNAVSDSTRGLAKMDATKKFRPPRRALKGDSGPEDFDTPVSLSVQATKHLRTFVEEFLDSGFNPLFHHIRKAIDREAERVLEIHQRQFFYLVSWFLEAERVRRRNKRTKNQKIVTSEETDSYSLVASVLNQEMFIALNRAMDSSYEHKSWQDLSSALKCFTQILLTVQEMSESLLEEDQEIAENILSRIFYEETTHDRVANITRTYKDQGFGYLDSCTDLCHNYLRILEQYSKQNVDMQVRSRRRIRRKKKAARAAGQDDADDAIVDESDGEDVARAERTSNERKFDFKRFAARFVSQGCVDTFVTFTAYYNDLTAGQLKRAHRYFYRVAFKQEMSVMLFRVDIIALFNKMIKGPEGLDPQSTCYKEWDEFVKQIIKRCTRKIQERPELVVEMLFSKINSTAHYLEYGYEKQVITTKPRAAAELEVKGGKEWEEQIAIVVGAMLDRNETDLLQWITAQLSSAEDERRSWEGANAALPSVEPADDPFAEPTDSPAVPVEPPKAPSILVRPRDDACKLATFKNGYLRLLMTLVSFQRFGAEDDPDASWVVPSELSADQLKQSHDLIKKAEFSPPVFDDGLEAGDFIRRKSAGYTGRRKAAFDDEDGIDDDEELLFPAGGPTPMNRADVLKELKTKRSRRKKDGEEEDGGLTDEQIKARAEARRLKELEKNRKIKSDLFVHDSDDESDEERDRAFFDAEKLRQKSNIKVMKELLGVTKPKKRMSSAMSDDSDDDILLSATATKKRRSSVVSAESDAGEDSGHSSSILREDDSEAEATDTPLSSPHARTIPSKQLKVIHDEEDKENSELGSPMVAKVADVEMDDEDEDIPIAKPARQRVRAGFIIDSSDEE